MASAKLIPLIFIITTLLIVPLAKASPTVLTYTLQFEDFRADNLQSTNVWFTSQPAIDLNVTSVTLTLDYSDTNITSTEESPRAYLYNATATLGLDGIVYPSVPVIGFLSITGVNSTAYANTIDDEVLYSSEVAHTDWASSPDLETDGTSTPGYENTPVDHSTLDVRVDDPYTGDLIVTVVYTLNAGSSNANLSLFESMGLIAILIPFLLVVKVLDKK